MEAFRGLGDVVRMVVLYPMQVLQAVCKIARAAILSLTQPRPLSNANTPSWY